MDNEALQKLVKEKPRIRCLLCNNFEQVVTYIGVYGQAGKPIYVSRCSKLLDMPGCGRNFNPRGGNAVPA